MEEDLLKLFVKKESHRSNIKKYLDKITTDEEIKKGIIYDLFSHYKEGGEFIMNMYKEKQYLFSHDAFDDIRTLIQEQEDFLNNPIRVEDGVIECHKCHSFKTFSYAKQTRASDEATSIFVTCAECKFQFKL